MLERIDEFIEENSDEMLTTGGWDDDKIAEHDRGAILSTYLKNITVLHLLFGCKRFGMCEKIRCYFDLCFVERLNEILYNIFTVAK